MSSEDSPSQVLQNTYDEQEENKEDNITKSRSIMNLTSSTLHGIYAPTALNESTPQTPWGTGAETPAIQDSVERMGSYPGQQRRDPIGEEVARRLRARSNQVNDRSNSQRQSKPITKPKPTKIILQNVVLFFFGVVYGGIISQLHSSTSISRVQLPKNELYKMDSISALYLAIWGVAGLGLGNLLPWIDKQYTKGSQNSSPKVAVGWNDAIRGIGSFVGVAFAIVCVL